MEAARPSSSSKSLGANHAGFKFQDTGVHWEYLLLDYIYAVLETIFYLSTCLTLLYGLILFNLFRAFILPYLLYCASVYIRLFALVYCISIIVCKSHKVSNFLYLPWRSTQIKTFGRSKASQVKTFRGAENNTNQEFCFTSSYRHVRRTPGKMPHRYFCSSSTGTRADRSACSRRGRRFRSCPGH